MKNEIILYQTEELTERIEVKLEDETVRLTQQQMATLFQQMKQNVSLQINNFFKEGELERSATVKESLTVYKGQNPSYAFFIPSFFIPSFFIPSFFIPSMSTH